MKKLFAVNLIHGAAWQHSRSLEEQADWAAHAAFMDALYAEGFCALAGPLEGTDDVLLIVHGDSADEIRERLAADPWHQNGLLRVVRIKPWTLRLGSVA